MKTLYSIIIGMVVYMGSALASDNKLPEGFIYLDQVDPSIKCSLRYYSEDNFLGRVVKGYNGSRVILSKEAAYALHKIQNELKKENLSLLIYDSYRPQQAVNDFIAWSEEIENSNSNKKWFYPNLDKVNLFSAGYIAKKSGHSRGSTVDLTIISQNQEVKEPKYYYIKLPNGQEIPFIDDGSINMGSSFDLLDEVSHTEYNNLSESAKINRKFLKDIMLKYGFENYYKEWWHFTLKDDHLKIVTLIFLCVNKIA
ncbi:D-alanyl-D-alanine dipeptidase [Rickettsiales bacterium Ac37b]|nr:D-alanyl-D-alanine dipeptidase [Rickettsiales bacterium Ac37b]